MPSRGKKCTRVGGLKMQVRLDRPAGAGRIRKKAFIQGHHAGQFGGKMPRVIDGQAAGISVQQLMIDVYKRQIPISAAG